MTKAYERLLKCYQCFKDKINFKPEVALVLGSGLGDYADTIRVEAVLDYHDIEGFPVSTVSGHKGRFVFGYVGGVPVVIMQGRVHYYEGYSMEDVVLPTRLMKMMGARILFLTNASGSVNYDYKAGDFMMITDQISNFVPSPLIGPNEESVSAICLRFTVRTFVRSSGVLLQTFRFRFRREPISSCPVRILKLPMK